MQKEDKSIRLVITCVLMGFEVEVFVFALL